MPFHLLCRAALAIMAAVTVISYTVGFPGTALPDGAVAALTLAPGAASVAALLLLPALDRGWAYAAGALVLLATPGITAAAAAALVAPSATLATIMHDAEAMTAALAVAERTFAPAVVASAVLISAVSFVAPRTAHVLAVATQVGFAGVSLFALQLSRTLAHLPSCGPAHLCRAEHSIRMITLALSISCLVFIALVLAKLCRAPRTVVRLTSAVAAVAMPALFYVVYSSEQQASDDFALRMAPGAPMLLGLSVLEVLRVLRVVVVTAVLPLLSVTLPTSHDTDCSYDDSESDANNDDAAKQCEVALEKQRLVEVV